MNFTVHYQGEDLSHHLVTFLVLNSAMVTESGSAAEGASSFLKIS